MNKKAIQIAKTILVAGSLLGFVAVAGASTWTPPTATPPAGNVDQPINIGSGAQGKLGTLRLGGAGTATAGSVLDVLGVTSTNGLVNLGTSVFNGLIKITAGSPGAGKVLTSDAAGNATWAAAAAGGITGSGTPTFLPKFGPAGTTLNDSQIKDNGGGGIIIGTGIQLKQDQGGAMELGAIDGAANTGFKKPYIDFHYGVGTPQDYNARIMNDSNNHLLIDSAVGITGNLTVAGQNVCRQDGTNCPAGSGGTPGPMGPAGPTGPMGPPGPTTVGISIYEQHCAGGTWLSRHSSADYPGCTSVSFVGHLVP